MAIFLRKSYLFCALLLIFPLAGFCQLPLLKWVNDIGGGGDSKPTGMITDNQNNVLVSGYFSGTVDFDPSTGVKNLTSTGGYDIYVAKYTSAGALIWAVSMGGAGLDQVNNMTVDANGNPTIIGQFQSPTLVAGSTSLQNQGAEDIFIIHLSVNGDILWAQSWGGGATDRGEEVTADSQGNLISTSIFQSTFPLGSTTVTSPGGQYNALVMKHDAAGNLLWDIDLGGNGDTEVYGLGIDSNGNIVISGSYSGSVDFDPLGAHNTLNNDTNTAFVAKYTPAGKLIWVNPINGSVVNNGSAVSIGLNDDIYVTAAFSSPVVFNAGTTLNPSGQDVFIAKYASSGSFQFARDLGGAGASAFPYQIRTDASNSVYVSGYFSGSIDFDPAPATTAVVSFHGQRDFFLVKLDQTGNYQWAFGGGSPNCNLTLGIEMAVNTNNEVVLGGSFCTTVNFDPLNCTAHNVTAQNSITDTFIATYSQNATPTTQITAFTIPQQIAPTVIDQINHTIALTVAPGSAITALAPSITVSNGGTASPASGTAQDFTSSVNYIANSACTPATYSVKVTLAVAKIDSTCSASAKTITGDAVGTTPDSYTWQALQGGVWTNAPGVVNGKDYETSGLINNANAPVTFQLRRQLSTAGVISYDSFYNLVVVPIIAITNNVLTIPVTSTFCISGDPGVITGSTPTGGTGTYTYQWQSSAGNVTFSDVPGATAKDFDPPALSVTTYYRRIVTSGVCVVPLASNSVAITITGLPATPVPVAATISICDGTTASLAVSSPQAGFTYDWYDSAAKTNHLFTGPSYTTGVLNSNETYYVGATNGSCSSVALAAVQVNVNSLPTGPQLLQSPVVVCSGSAATLSISTPQAGFTYNWYAASTGGSILFTGTDFAQATVTGNVTYYAEAVNSSGCASATRTAGNITVNALPQITASNAGACPGSSTTLTATSTGQNAAINWYAAATGGNILFTGNTFTTPVLNATTSYYAEAVDNTTGCVSAARSQVQATILQQLAAPVVTAGATTATSIIFQWTAVPGATGYLVSTDNGQTFNAPTSGSDSLTEKITGLQPETSVTILVKALGSQPCQLSGSSTAVTAKAVNPSGNQIYVANAFTPNGDGKNDVVYVHSETIKSMKFYIYDQWGELLYKSDSQQNGWDGTYKGKKEPVGVYVYYVEAVLTDGQQITKKGTITLLK
jgi:gliding motility-associated-like protein